MFQGLQSQLVQSCLSPSLPAPSLLHRRWSRPAFLSLLLCRYNAVPPPCLHWLPSAPRLLLNSSPQAAWICLGLPSHHLRPWSVDPSAQLQAFEPQTPPRPSDPSAPHPIGFTVVCRPSCSAGLPCPSGSTLVNHCSVSASGTPASP